MKDYTGDKVSFWGAMAVPWEGANPVKVGVMSFVLACGIMGVVFLVVYLTGKDGAPIPLQLLLLPVAIPLLLLPVRVVANRVARKIEGNSLVQSDCTIVHGVVEKPGVAAVIGNELLIVPIVGEKVRVELSRIRGISELRYFNGRPYVGTARFFKIEVPEEVSRKGRLGFGVANAAVWRRVLEVGD